MKTRVVLTLGPRYFGNRTARRFLTAALLLASLLVSLASGVRAQDCSGDSCQSSGGPPVVTITQIDNQAFPQVIASVTVSDQDGIPLDGLTKADFQLFEDGSPIPSGSFTVRQNDSQTLGLVLALDVSTSQETLTQLQAAANTFVDGLSPQDQAAVLAFYDQVQVAQDFTQDKTDLKAAIDALQVQGNYTALNEAVRDAVAMVGARPLDRRVAIILTDSANNIGTLSTADAINAALQGGISIYTIGIEPKVDPLALEDMADLTGGQFFILTCPNQAEDSLHRVKSWLHPGYLVAFESGLQADAAEHDLSIGVTHQGQQGQTAGRFVALPGEVTVTLLGVTDGQKVGGLVGLAARASGPAAIVSVEYLLDGQPLAQRAISPYSFDWDSTSVAPQTYTLGARATDQAGNQGETQVRLKVAPPMTVTLSTTQQEAELGERVTVEAQVEALGEVTEVEFLLDDQPLGSVNAPPYRVSFDNSPHQAGEHTLTARAKDNLGRQAQGSLNLQFLPPAQPEPQPSAQAGSSNGRDWSQYLEVGVAIIALVAAVCTALVALLLIRWWQRKRYQKKYRLNIQNLGNVRSRYKLLAKDPAGALKFQFTLNGTNLHERQITEMVEVEPSPAASPLQPVARPTQADRPARPSVPGELKDTKQKASQALGAGKGMANFLASLGALLPGSAGASLRSKASQMSMQQSKMDYAMQTPDRLGKRIQDVSSKAPQAAALSSQAASVAEQAPSPQQAMPAVEQAEITPQPAAPVTQRGRPSPTTIPVTRTIVDRWGQTPVLEPGTSLTVDLTISPAQRPRRAQSYPFTVTSQSVEQKGAPALVQEGQVHIESGAWFRYYLPPTLAFLAVIAIEVLILGFLMTRMGILG